jgi:hypothetical protein
VTRQHSLLAIQAVAALLVIATTAGVGLAAIAATTGCAVRLTRYRGADVVATVLFIATALVTLVASGSTGVRPTHGRPVGSPRSTLVQHELEVQRSRHLGATGNRT